MPSTEHARSVWAFQTLTSTPRAMLQSKHPCCFPINSKPSRRSLSWESARRENRRVKKQLLCQERERFGRKEALANTFILFSFFRLLIIKVLLVPYENCKTLKTQRKQNLRSPRLPDTIIITFRGPFSLTTIVSIFVGVFLFERQICEFPFLSQ